MGEVISGFEDGMPVARLRGVFTLETGVQAIAGAMASAIAQGQPALLVDLLELQGVASPGIGERHWVMTELARVGRGNLRVALLIRPEFRDPDKYGTAVAISRGFDARGFLDVASALAWLRRESD